MPIPCPTILAFHFRCTSGPTPTGRLGRTPADPGSRLSAGGRASYLATSRNDYALAYGAFLAFLQRTHRFERHPPAAAAQVTFSDAESYIADLSARVRSVTVHMYVYHLRRAAELLAPSADFSWLAEIEKDLELVMEPRSNSDRLVFSGWLVQAGLTLAAEAQEFAANDLARARGVRNGLMIALLAFCPIRLKNFAALEIDHTFKKVDERWWITLPSVSTKSRRPDERCVPELLNPVIHVYLTQSRPVLLCAIPTNALWISSNTGGPITTNNLSTLISKYAETIGVDVSPHLFRTAAASTAAAYGSATPHLASALLNHADPERRRSITIAPPA